MVTTVLSPDTSADVARVTEALGMITPRWNARILLALSGRPLRYSELSARLSWLKDGQLHPKTVALCEAGLVERTEHSARNVTYTNTDRGTALLPVLPLLVTWAETHLETTDRPTPAIEQIEDSLTLLTRRHATAILWVLKSQGEVSGPALGKVVLPGNGWTNIYPPLRQLAADGLVDTDGEGHPYRLSAAGDALGPVFGALSAWAAGRPLTQAAQHPLWGSQPDVPAPKAWVSNQPRPTTGPVPVSEPTQVGGQSRPAWHNRDLFSHPAAARPQAALPAGGPRR